MRFLAALLLLACNCTAGLPDAQKPVPGSPVEHAILHTAFLNPPGCTGVEVARNVVVTAKHCLEGKKRNDNFSAGGVVWYVDKTYDYAVIVFTGDPLRLEQKPKALGVEYISMRQARIGEHLYVVGYPVQLGDHEQALTVTDGVRAGPVDDEGQERITAEVYFGNSGGGVWGDDGALLGISVAVFADDSVSPPMPYPGQGFMVPIALIRKHLPIPQ